MPRYNVGSSLPGLLALGFAAALGIGIGMLGCASGDRPLEEVDPAAVSANPTYDQVFVVFQRSCIPCHNEGEDGGGDDGRGLAPMPEGPSGGAGVEPDLRTCSGILDNLDDCWGVIRKNTMPPGAWPRLTSEEKLLIERWIENGAPAPCAR